MDIGSRILSSVVTFSKYAKYIPELKRRETWEEIVSRYEVMMMKKHSSLKKEILGNASFIHDKKVLPSMRALQFAGPAAELTPNRVFNCAYAPVDSIYAFSEGMFLLLGGSGVGYSVQTHHVEKLPEIIKPFKTKKYVVQDSIIGWADAVKALMKSYFGKGAKPIFDFRDIRPKGARLVTAGGKAPGPEPLKICLTHIEVILERKQTGDKLTSLECHDIMCHIANAVLSGGIRRAAMISFFSFDDNEMLTCKYGNWWELNEQRGRANNSVVIDRRKISKEDFDQLWKKIELSGSGEPGIYFTNNCEMLSNPCCFTGDMTLLTPSGYRRLDELAIDEHVQLINYNGETVNGKIWSNGTKHTIRLKLSNKKIITCTPDHRLMISDGEEIEAQYTKRLRLMPYFNINQELNDFAKYGFIQGDASTGRLASETHRGLEIYFGEKDLDVAEFFNLDMGRVYINGYNEILKDLGFSENVLPNRTMPSSYHLWSDSDMNQFLKGMYSANGSVIKTSRVAYKTTCKILADQLVELLSERGLHPYITTNKEKNVQFSNGNYTCKESYDVNIGQIEDIKWFAEHIGFIQKYKQESLSKLIKERAPIVLTIDDYNIQEVFDFSLDDDDHWGVVEGIVAHNCEIALKPFQFCNLCEVNVSNIQDEQDLLDRVRIAAFFGTLQASFTDYHYLRPIWQKTTEKDALLGIGMTGIASGEILKYDLKKAAKVAMEENERVANLIGINKAARVTCVKPSGTTSTVLGVSSGIHAWHDYYYLRTIRFNKNEDIAKYLMKNHPELCEDDVLRSHDTICVRIPIKAPEGSIIRTETSLELLERVKKFSMEWIKPGHRKGDNTHNVSATVSIKDQEWQEVGEWMWQNKEYYNGLSVLPFSGGNYTQAPFESITEEEYNERISYLKDIDLSQVLEDDDLVDFGQVAACAGNACELI